MSGTPSRTFPTTRALPSRAESSNPIQNFPKQKHTTAGFPPPLPIRALPPKLESNLPLLHTPNPPSPEEVPRSPRPMTMVRCPSRFPSTPTREIHDFPLLIRSDCLLRSCSCRWCLFDLMDWMGAAAGAGRGRGGRRGGRRGAGSALRVQAGAAHHQLPLRRYASASRRLRVC
jgi:hypothetical protein